jgi:hypothetical protein
MLRGFTKIRPVGAEFFQEDGRTDGYGEPSSRFSQFCAGTLKKKKQKYMAIHENNLALSCNYVHCLIMSFRNVFAFKG